MMLKIGITGGIGSGKTMVCRVFQSLGVPVLYADEVGALLMAEDEDLQKKIREVFGDSVWVNGAIDRRKLGARVFGHPKDLQLLESWIHPRVIEYSQSWFLRQNAPYAIKEAALFFEAGTAGDMDLMVGVKAPRALRLQRTRERDGIGEEAVIQRMNRQMDEEEKLRLCDDILINDGVSALIPQILERDARWKAMADSSANPPSSPPRVDRSAEGHS